MGFVVRTGRREESCMLCREGVVRVSYALIAHLTVQALPFQSYGTRWL